MEFFLSRIAQEYRCVDDALKLVDHRFEFISREGRKQFQRIFLRRLHLPEDGEDHADREESDGDDDNNRGLQHGLHGIRGSHRVTHSGETDVREDVDYFQEVSHDVQTRFLIVHENELLEPEERLQQPVVVHARDGVEEITALIVGF